MTSLSVNRVEDDQNSNDTEFYEYEYERIHNVGEDDDVVFMYTVVSRRKIKKEVCILDDGEVTEWVPENEVGEETNPGPSGSNDTPRSGK